MTNYASLGFISSCSNEESILLQGGGGGGGWDVDGGQGAEGVGGWMAEKGEVQLSTYAISNLIEGISN